MNLSLSDEALFFADSAMKAIETAGGDLLVQQAERDPGVRTGPIPLALEALGAWELDPRSSAEELEAAAALCRAAGYWVLPYPVAERLARPRDGADGLVVVADENRSAALAGLDLHWDTVTLDGRRGRAGPVALEGPARASAFVGVLEVAATTEPCDAAEARADAALGLVLGSWTLLGMLDRAVALTCSHIVEREQFGQPLGAFQGVQFDLTDAEVERAGAETLARYALWSVATGGADALADALACRLAAVEAADTVFRVAHQLHGAIGFCDETTVSWVSRYSIPLRRHPYGPAALADRLAGVVGRSGLTGPFSHTAGS